MICPSCGHTWTTTKELRRLQSQWARDNYWCRVVVPAARIERGRLRAAGGMGAEIARKVA